MALNTEQKIPAKSVTAKPLMGPTPKLNRINATKPVVTFASKIALQAFE